MFACIGRYEQQQHEQQHKQTWRACVIVEEKITLTAVGLTCTAAAAAI